MWPLLCTAKQHVQRKKYTQRDSRIHWEPEEVRKVMYFNKVWLFLFALVCTLSPPSQVYNVVRVFFIRLNSGEVVTHMEAFNRGVGGEPLCFVD